MSARVFVDTSTYFALTDRRDDNHTAAELTARRFTQDGADLYTTNFVVAETHALILNRIGRDVAAQVLERLYASETRILRATESDERRAREIIIRQRDKDYRTWARKPPTLKRGLKGPVARRRREVRRVAGPSPWGETRPVGTWHLPQQLRVGGATGRCSSGYKPDRLVDVVRRAGVGVSSLRRARPALPSTPQGAGQARRGRTSWGAPGVLRDALGFIRESVNPPPCL
jgi:predicted nucleic acid-binding protein